MTSEQVQREHEIRYIRKELLKLKDGTLKGYFNMSNEIDELYFNNKINNIEHDNMKSWLNEIYY